MQIRITDGAGKTTELIAFAEPDIHGDEYKYTDLDGDRLAIFTALIPDLGAGINIVTTEAGASFPLADVPALVDAIWAKAQQAAHFHGQLPCPHPRCGPCTADADARLAESEALAAVNDGPLVEQLPAELLHEAADAIAAEAERGSKAGLTRIYMRGHANRLRLLADERHALEAGERRSER